MLDRTRRTLRTVATILGIALILVACRPPGERAAEPPVPAPRTCRAGGECGEGAVCVMPTTGGAPRPEPDQGRCAPVPEACGGEPTCECLVAARTHGGPAASCTEPFSAAVSCGLTDGVLRCACLMCP